MLGYVTIEKGELKVREYEIYNGYYCGMCKSIGSRIGQVPRMALSYDLTFLAIVLGSLNESKEKLELQHCIVHHIDKKPVVLDEDTVDYAADVMVILAYEKFLDDWRDDKSIKALAAKTTFFKSFRKVKEAHPLICEKVEMALKRLSLLEEEKSGNIDETCEAFADVMEPLFSGYMEDEATNRILASMGRQLGKWIYLMDALDDLQKDIDEDKYNPLKYRYPNESVNEIKNKVEPVLYNYLAQTANAFDLLNIKKNKGIIDNIIFMGLRRRTDNVLKKGTEE